MRKNITYWNVAVPKPLNKALERAIANNMHMTKADFIRDVVRRELERTGYLQP
jgi:metal-responsive CopG/Arc/MetJ family transcriptional regulator